MSKRRFIPPEGARLMIRDVHRLSMVVVPGKDKTHHYVAQRVYRLAHEQFEQLIRERTLKDSK